MCVSPVFIKFKDSHGLTQSLDVPCGNCYECCKSRQDSWKIRLSEEAKSHQYMYFVTLTYDNEHVPKVCYNGEDVLSLRKSDVQGWIKRNKTSFTRALGRNFDLKWFVCGEYGPNTVRPHYHAIFFTELDSLAFAKFVGSWHYGFTKLDDVYCHQDKKSVDNVADYVAKYVVKPQELLSDKQKYNLALQKLGVIEKCSSLVSHGLGKAYVDKMYRWHVPNRRRFNDTPSYIKTIVDRYHYHTGKFKYNLPRYYKDRFYKSLDVVSQKYFDYDSKTIKVKQVKRYRSSNLLSLQMRNEIQHRILVEYNKLVEQIRCSSPGLSADEIHIKATLAEKSSRLSKSKDTFAKLSRFYNSHYFGRKQL